MVYSNCKIYGPYTRKDCRQQVTVTFPDKRRVTVSYPKYLIEKHFDRYLERNETVDHIDGNFRNNEISNLQVLDRAVHAALDAKRCKPGTFVCPWCNSSFVLSGRQVSNSNRERKRGKAGPFCSRKCSGTYGASVQQGHELLEVKNLTPEYTTLKAQQGLERETV